MAIYLILIILTLILPKVKKISKKYYCLIIGLLMTLIVGFRDINMGMGDTAKIYISIFDSLSKLSFRDSFIFIQSADIEIVFYMMTRIYIFFTSNVRIYLILLAIPINFCVSRMIYKYSDKPSLSFIMYIALNYFAFSFTLLRHCIALAILILSYDFLKEKKLRKFLITVFIAGLFHRTAWIFSIAYIVNYIKFDEKKNIIYIIVSLITSFFIGSNLLKFILQMINSTHYLQYINAQNNTLTFFLINLSILFFIAIFCHKYVKNGSSSVDLQLTTIGICLATCMIFISEAFRLSSFFTIYTIIALPNAIQTIDNKTRKMMFSYILYVVFIMYFLGFTINNNQIYPYIIGGLIR